MKAHGWNPVERKTLKIKTRNFIINGISSQGRGKNMSQDPRREGRKLKLRDLK